MFKKEFENQYHFSIGAIFKDEYEYVLEWISWHLMCGFEHFYIADNGSSDGTVELLEALSELGLVTIIYQEQKLKCQLDAYSKILKKAMLNNHEILFIDADEFIYSNINITGFFTKIFNENFNIGAMAFNWKVFGSSGHVDKVNDLVLRRFTKHSNQDMPQTHFIKSLVRPHAVTQMRVHHAQLKNGYDYVNAIGEKLTFINGKNQVIDEPSGLTFQVIEDPISIHHYVVKSKQEYNDKKRRRGDAMIGSDHDRGEAYFNIHDRNDREFLLDGIDFEKLEDTISSLELRLSNETNLGSDFSGHIDACNDRFVRGWVYAENSKSSRPLKVNIFVNGIYIDSIFANGFRKDLKKKFGTSGNYSFHYTFPKRLNNLDKVLIRPVSSAFQFPPRPMVVESGQY
ncbi:MAG: hypothetical protein ACJAWQ_002801 [Paraglaciecola sp.]|jgi:hypothetical protein